MKEIIIGLVSAVISGVFSIIITRSNNKSKLEILNKEMEVQQELVKIEKDKAKNDLTRINNEHNIEISKLKSLLELKDKEMSFLKLQFDLEDQAKQSDTMNPMMSDLLRQFMDNPVDFSSKIEKMKEVSDRLNQPKPLQGHKKKVR